MSRTRVKMFISIMLVLVVAFSLSITVFAQSFSSIDSKAPVFTFFDRSGPTDVNALVNVHARIIDSGDLSLSVNIKAIGDSEINGNTKNSKPFQLFKFEKVISSDSFQYEESFIDGDSVTEHYILALLTISAAESFFGEDRLVMVRIWDNVTLSSTSDLNIPWDHFDMIDIYVAGRGDPMYLISNASALSAK